MKKKLMALLMATVLVLGTGSTALADINSPVVDNTKPEINSPVVDNNKPEINSPVVDNDKPEIVKVQVTWSSNDAWTVDIENVAKGEDRVGYDVYLYKGDFQVEWYSVYGAAGEKFTCDVSEAVEQYGEGEYWVSAYTYYKGVDYSGYTDVREYTKTALEQLETPKVSISEDGILTLTGVDHADRYYVYLGFAFVGETQYHSMYQFKVEQSELKDGKYTYDIKKDVADSVFADYEGSVKATVEAVGLGENEYEDSEYGRSNEWEYRISVEKAEGQLDEALKSEDPADAKNILTSLSNETVAEIMKEDIAKVEKADEAWAEEKGIKVESKSEVKVVDATKVTIVGAALNADGEEEKDVVLSFAEPEKKVEVDKKYTNTVALDIKLFVAGESKSELAVPVAITMPIPEGVVTKNLVILHFHGDAEEPAVIEPTVNKDGTMTFIVDGFSTFVVANQAVIDVPATGDNSDVTVVLSLLLMAAGVVLVVKRNAFAK